MNRRRFDAVAALALAPCAFGALEITLALLGRGAFDARALVVGAACLAPAGAVAGVSASLAVHTRWSEAVVARRRRSPLPDRRDAVAELVAFALLVGGASVLASLVAGAAVGGIRTPRFAAAVAFAIATSSVIGAILVAPSSGVPVSAFARRVEPRARVAIALSCFAVALCVAILLRGAIGALAPSTWLSASSAIAIAVAMGLIVGRRHGGPTRASPALVFVILLALSPAVLPRSFSAARAACAEAPGLVGASTRLVTRILDVDGDGAASGAFGDDCAPLSSARGPFALEVAGNGVDEDCSGVDLVLPPRGVTRGEPRSADGIEGIVERPHVVLVTTDALTFGHTSLGGYALPTTPHLAAFAADATNFVRGFSTSSATCNAIPALHTGRLALHSPGLLPPAYQTGAERGAAVAPTLAETLRAAGYRTVGLAGARLFSSGAWPELARGFDVIDTPGLENARSDTEKRYLADLLTDRALAEVRREDPRPLFLWVHYFDHHGPHGVPPGASVMGDGKSELARYDTELAYADRAWGRLFEGIASAWPQNQAIVFFTADHGEAFDENHGLGRHETSLRSPEVHVPFVVRGPRGRGEVRTGLVSHLDVMATIVDLVVPRRPDLVLDGETLVPALFAGREPGKSVVFSLLWQPRQGPVGAPAMRSAAIRTEDALYVDDREHQTRALYAWRTDRLERTDLSDGQPATAEWMRFVLAEELRRAP